MPRGYCLVQQGVKTLASNVATCLLTKPPTKIFPFKAQFKINREFTLVLEQTEAPTSIVSQNSGHCRQTGFRNHKNVDVFLSHATRDLRCLEGK